MMKFIKVLAAFLIVIVVVYLLGPTVSFPPFVFDKMPSGTEKSALNKKEFSKREKLKKFKPGNQSKLLWADSLTKAKTEYVLLFLHGFSASPMEGIPVASEIAKAIGANMYAPLIAGHGYADKNTFKGIQPQEWIDSAIKAYQKAKQYGDKVIIASSSTGGTLSIILAAQFPDVHCQLLYAPNINLADTNSELILKPWGNRMLNLVEGGAYRVLNHLTAEQKRYWNDIYHTDGVVALKFLLNKTMTKERFEQISQALFIGCYYKDNEHQDHVVSVKRMRDLYDQVSTPEGKKMFLALPEAKNHVLTSDLFYKDNKQLIEASILFLEQQAGVEIKEKAEVLY